MITRTCKLLIAASLICTVLGNSPARGKAFQAGPQNLSQVSSLGKVLAEAGQRPVHIIYLHGIGAVGSGDSQVLQKKICEFLKDCTSRVPPDFVRGYADHGVFAEGSEPPFVKYIGEPIWTEGKEKEEWSAADPFVDHYVLRRSNGGLIVVDEINWWPLVFPLKCRKIMPGEARLAGPDADRLNLCAKDSHTDPGHRGRYTAYQWLLPEDAKKLKAMKSRGAWLNRGLKNTILDWGFSDAVLAVGSMHDVLREAVRQLFVKSVEFNPVNSNPNEWEEHLNSRAPDQQFIVVSHSLGSYLVFSTLPGEQQDSSPLEAAAPASHTAREDAAARYIFERTSLVYFFANQVPLLELSSLEAPPFAPSANVEGAAQPRSAATMSNQLTKWRDLRERFRSERTGAEKAVMEPPQLVAWSDPSDLLTWYVPPIEGLVVANLYVRNTCWHWLIANPQAAHDNYDRNKEVLRVLLRHEKGEGKQ